MNECVAIKFIKWVQVGMCLSRVYDALSTLRLRAHLQGSSTSQLERNVTLVRLRCVKTDTHRRTVSDSHYYHY